MSRLRFTLEAENDLHEIFDYISTDSPSSAAKLVARIRDRCELLATFPELGMERVDLSPGLRLFAVGNYAVFYRIVDEVVFVVRIVSGFRDIDALFH